MSNVTLYSLSVGNEVNKRTIILKDGRLVSPHEFVKEGIDSLDAYAYLLPDSLGKARIYRSIFSRTYSESDSYLKSREHKGIELYMPNRTQIRALYDSIINPNGIMRKDLEEAGILNRCNYQLIRYSSDGWGSVMFDAGIEDKIGILNGNGSEVLKYKDGPSLSYIIPFMR